MGVSKMETTIGRRIRQSCKAKKVSQKTLAEKMGWDESQLSRVINDQRKVSAGEIAEIATILDISLDWLITGDDKFWVPSDVAARHDRDPETGEYRQNLDDLDVFRSIGLVYKQAYR